jgi:hypothetical protein
MCRVALDDPCLDSVGKDAAKKTDGARRRSSTASDDGISPQLLGLDRNPRFPAIMSLRTLLMSVLVRSLTAWFLGAE